MDYVNEKDLPDGIGVNNYDVETNLKTMIRKLNKDHGYFLVRKDFCHCIILNEREINPPVIAAWMQDNLDGNSITVWNGAEYKYHFFFIEDHDAMGFRLLWEFD